MLASYVAITKVHIAEVLANQYIHLLAIAIAIYCRNQLHAYVASYIYMSVYLFYFNYQLLMALNLQAHLDLAIM